MSYKCGTYPIIEKNAISAGIFSYTVFCPEVAELAMAGQFVHIRVEGFTLRRPISICDIDKSAGTIRIVFEVRGAGTDGMSRINVGDNIDMIAPLGNGFSIGKELEPQKKAVVVGGGIGVPPLLAVAKSYGKSAQAIIGFRSYNRVVLKEDFEQAGAETVLCTDDGSIGLNGLVTVPLKKMLEEKSVGVIYACGPTPMIKAVAALAQEYEVECEVSLEQRMGCGVGACVGCACTVIRGGKEFVLRVCKDGPVFKGEEVVF